MVLALLLRIHGSVPWFDSYLVTELILAFGRRVGVIPASEVIHRHLCFSCFWLWFSLISHANTYLCFNLHLWFERQASVYVTFRLVYGRAHTHARGFPGAPQIRFISYMFIHMYFPSVIYLCMRLIGRAKTICRA